MSDSIAARNRRSGARAWVSSPAGGMWSGHLGFDDVEVGDVTDHFRRIAKIERLFRREPDSGVPTDQRRSDVPEKALSGIDATLRKINDLSLLTVFPNHLAHLQIKPSYTTGQALLVASLQSAIRSGAIASQSSAWGLMIDGISIASGSVAMNLVVTLNAGAIVASAKALRSIPPAASSSRSATLPPWVLGFYSDCREKASRLSLRRLVSEMGTLLKLRDFQAINEILAKVDWTKLPPAVIMGLVRSSAVARHRLPSWGNAARAALSELKGRGLPAEMIMMGLIEKSNGHSDSRTT